MSKIVCKCESEARRHSLCATVGAEQLGEIELTDVELEAIYGAHGYGFAPVSPTCLQSILLGDGDCGTQSLGQDHFYVTASKDPG